MVGAVKDPGLGGSDFDRSLVFHPSAGDRKGRGAGALRKEIVLRNLESLLEHDDFDRAEYSQKRHGYLAEIHALHRKMEDTRKELDELRKRKSDEADFAKFVSEADAFKAVTHRIMNLPFPDKQRLLRGVLDGPIVVGHSTLIPHCEQENEDLLEEILKHTTMTVRHNQPLLFGTSD